MQKKKKKKKKKNLGHNYVNICDLGYPFRDMSYQTWAMVCMR